MKNSILVIGEACSGKSASLRNLDPKETYIINVLGKELPFKGWMKNYKKDSPETKNGNYYISDNHEKIINVMQYINRERPDIKTIIVDDYQFIMGHESMRRASDKEYGKENQIGKKGWSVIFETKDFRDDLFTFFLCHSLKDKDGISRPKTVGKIFNESISIEGMFTLILHSFGENGKHHFLTQTDGVHMARSPIGMFDSFSIENDLKLVKKKIFEYRNDDEDIPQ